MSQAIQLRFGFMSVKDRAWHLTGFHNIYKKKSWQLSKEFLKVLLVNI